MEMIMVFKDLDQKINLTLIRTCSQKNDYRQILFLVSNQLIKMEAYECDLSMGAVINRQKKKQIIR